MTQTKRYHLINSLLLLIAILSFWGWYSFPQKSKATTKTYAVDAFAMNVEATQFNELGQLRGEIKSPKVLHFTEGDSAFFTTPFVTLYSQGGKAPWLISAKTGKTLNGTQQIDLIDNVVIHQPTSAQNTDTVIKTSLLHIYPKKQFADTDQAVTLVQPGVTVNAVGMNAYLDQKHVVLLSNTRGSYDPHQAKSTHTVF